MKRIQQLENIVGKQLENSKKTLENCWEYRKTPKIIWYHPENNWGPIIDDLVQFEEDFNSGTKKSVRSGGVGIGYVRPVQFLNHLTVIKRKDVWIQNKKFKLLRTYKTKIKWDLNVVCLYTVCSAYMYCFCADISDILVANILWIQHICVWKANSWLISQVLVWRTQKWKSFFTPNPFLQWKF